MFEFPRDLSHYFIFFLNVKLSMQRFVFSNLFYSGSRLHHDDATAVHQLQNEVCGPPPMEDAHLQGSEHVHR